MALNQGLRGSLSRVVGWSVHILEAGRRNGFKGVVLNATRDARELGRRYDFGDLDIPFGPSDVAGLLNVRWEYRLARGVWITLRRQSRCPSWVASGDFTFFNGEFFDWLNPGVLQVFPRQGLTATFQKPM